MNIFFKKPDLSENYLNFKNIFFTDLMSGRLIKISVRNGAFSVIANFCELAVTEQGTYLEFMGHSNLSCSFDSGYVGKNDSIKTKSLFLTKRECEDFLFFLLNVSNFDVKIEE